MRTHAEIIKGARAADGEKSGPHALARMLHPAVGGDLDRLQKRVRAWLITDSIPGEYWSLLESANVAPVAELSGYALSKLLAKSPSSEDRSAA